jgi:rubrerythrin
MKTYICQICGDAYLGTEKPKSCPFCGAREHFMKEGKEATPIVNNKVAIGEKSGVNLQEALGLELRANLIYLCMAGKAKKYELKAMYKRLAKVEMEHAVIICKLMDIALPTVEDQTCSDEELENFQKTVALEEHASELYARFAKEATEQEIKILFTALNQVEIDHIELIKNYL